MNTMRKIVSQSLHSVRVVSDEEVLEIIEIYDLRVPTCLPVASIDMEATYALYIYHRCSSLTHQIFDIYAWSSRQQPQYST